MTPQSRFGAALNRITSMSSVHRNRTAEAQRREVRGEQSQRDERLEAVVSKLEALADEMEAALR